MECMQRRREDLERKECELKESLIKFDQFFKDNDGKRVRATKKISAEKGLQQQKQTEINILSDDIARLTKMREKQEKKVKSLVKYRLFLESVVKMSDEFSDIYELISREPTKLQDLKSLDSKTQKLIDSKSSEIVHFKKTKQDEKLSLTNEIAELRNHLELQQVSGRNKETQWEHTRDLAANRIYELSTIVIAVANMYTIVRSHQKYGESAKPNETCKQLRAIKTFIQTLIKIIEEQPGVRIFHG
ncbi:unnamed protein product [Schistosoma spindalis]|nr:unnamed protein product [Schistosoma spindale]